MAGGRVLRHLVVEGGDHGAHGRRVLLLVDVIPDDHGVGPGLRRDRPEGAAHLDADLGANLSDDGHSFLEGGALDDLVRDWKADGT